MLPPPSSSGLSGAGLLAVALALSGAGLLAGPAILSLGRGRTSAAALVEGLTLGLVPTMVLLRLLPHVADSLGVWAVVLFALAFVALRAFDRAHHRAAARVGRAFIYSALALHSFTDGVGLAAAIAATPAHGALRDTTGLTLAFAFVVHRLPEGLFIATTLMPTYGRRRTLVRTLGLFAATIAGGVLGGALLPRLPERLFDGVVALALGAMLQLVLHSHAERPTKPLPRALAGAALIVGVVVTLLAPTPDDLLMLARHDELPVSRSFGPLFVWTAPLFLAALAGSTVLRALLRTDAPRASASALDGVLFGAVAPVGPAHGVAAARGLVLAGASRPAVVAFVLSVCALTLDGALVSWRLLGPWLTVARLASAALIALAGGFLARRGAAASSAPRPSSRARRGGAPVTLFMGAVDQLGASYCVGLLLAATVEAAVDPRWVAALGPIAWIVGPSLLAFLAGASPLLLLPVAAVLLHKGAGSAAALALVLAGPIGGRARFALSSSKLMPVLSYVAVLALAWSLGHVPAPAPAMHAWAARTPSLVELVLAGVTAMVLAASLLRLGPRLWFEQLLVDPSEEEDDHDHAHDDHHHHDHGDHGSHARAGGVT